MFKDITLGTIWVGEVINVNDPLKLGRVKIRILGKNDKISEDILHWSLPYSQLSTGTLILPLEKDLVNVFFENGDENVSFYYSAVSLNEDLKTTIKSDYPNIWSLVYDKNLKLQIFYTKTQGLVIKQNNSIINIKQDGSILLSNNKKTFHINNEHISIGKESKSDEPVTKANSLEQTLIDFIKDLGNIGSITTPVGPTSTINSSPGWTQLMQKWGDKDKSWKPFKSTIVSTD